MTIYVLSSLVLIASVVLAWGLRGKRIGDKPHCRRCGYGLTGLIAERCPECATAIDASSVVYSVRRRRPVPLAIGVVLLILSTASLSTLLYGKSRNINWYTHYPESFLRSLAKMRDTAAATELARRLQLTTTPRLPEEFIDFVLEEHASCPTPNAGAWADILASCLNNGWLSDGQMDQFFQHIAPLSLHVRPRMQEWDRFVFAVHREARGSRLISTELKMRIDDVTADGSQRLRCFPRWSSVSHAYGGKGAVWSSKSGSELVTGDHSITCSITLGMFDSGVDPDDATPLWSHSLTLEAKTVVSPKEDCDPITLVDRPSLAASLHKTMTLESVQIQPRDDRPDTLSASFSLKEPAPLCLAFDAYVVTEDQRIHVGPVSWRKGEDGGEFAHTFRPPFREPLPDLPSEVHVELVASRDAASENIDCYEVWDGTLRLGPVALSLQSPTPSTTRGTVSESDREEQPTALAGSLEEHDPQVLEELSQVGVRMSGSRHKQADVNGDGVPEVLVRSLFGGISIIDSQGTLMDSVTLEIPAGMSLSAYEPVLQQGELNWLISVSRFGPMGRSSHPKIMSCSATGSTLWTYDPGLPDEMNADVRLASADLDLNGTVELIIGLTTYEREQTGERSFTLKNRQASLLILSSDGTIVAQRSMSGGMEDLWVGNTGAPHARPVIICGGTHGLRRFVFAGAGAAHDVPPASRTLP